MITMTQPLPCGNAVRLYLTPPAGATEWRVLRRSTTEISGPDDAGAAVIADGSTDEVLLDTMALVNDVEYRYRAFYVLADGSWLASDSVVATPAATYFGEVSDPAAVFRERMALGLAVEVKRGALKPAAKKIPVIPHAFALQAGTSIPVVSVHMDSNKSGERAIGEAVYSDEFVEGVGWVETEGWLVDSTISVVGVSVNADERSALRKAMLRVLTTNLPVFHEAGFNQIEFDESEYEDFEQQNAPLFFTLVKVRCMAPFFVQTAVGPITDVNISINT